VMLEYQLIEKGEKITESPVPKAIGIGIGFRCFRSGLNNIIEMESTILIINWFNKSETNLLK